MELSVHIRQFMYYSREIKRNWHTLKSTLKIAIRLLFSVLECFWNFCGFFLVEMERFELSSKRGHNMLSTCLFPTWLSAAGRTGTTNLKLISWNLGTPPENRRSQLRIYQHHLVETSRSRAIGWCLVPATVAGIKLTYCTSVRQRERSYFRQLNF